MVNFIVRRLITAVFVLLIVTLVVFGMVRILPGDPILMILSRDQVSILTPEQIEEARHEFGLDKPILMQYIYWLPGIFHGDLGTSLYYREPVVRLLGERLPVTLHLGLIAFFLSNIIGITAGVFSALRRGGKLDFVLTILTNIGITIPIFWLGIMLIYVFGLNLGWLPTNGYTSPLDDFWLSTKKSIMPIICLSIFAIGSLTRQTRSSMLEVTRQDYIRTAWAKGLKERVIVVRHILKNGLIPITTLSGMQLSQIIGGSVLTETVFNVPGMGRLAVDAVLTLDYTVVQAIILLIAIMVTLVNLLVDISYGWLDPRIRYN